MPPAMALKPDDALGPVGEVIPENIITRPPTAELRENQTDQDSLPPYAVLDDILACFVEEEMALADVIAGRPSDPRALYQLSLVERRLGDYSQAEASSAAERLPQERQHDHDSRKRCHHDEQRRGQRKRQVLAGTQFTGCAQPWRNHWAASQA